MRALMSAFAVTLSLAVVAPADAATLSVTTSGSDTAACSQAAPCKSFNAAYRKAAAGDVVEVAAGSYGGQSIAARSVAGAPITIRAAAGASVTLSGSLDINTSNIVVQGFKASDLNVDNGSTVLSDVTTIGIDAKSAYFQNTKNLVVKGGRLGGLNNKTPVYVGALPMSYNVTFDGVEFHDATVTDSTVHTECLMVNDVQGMVIKNSRFTNCGYFGLMISHLMGELPPRDVTLENNVFEQTFQWNGQPAPYSMLIGPINANNFVIRNNTFVSEPTFNNTTWSNGSKFVGNLGVLNKCQTGAAYANNVWTSVSCGTGDKKSSTLANGYVNPAGHDWRLKAGAVAIDAASKTDYPATDQDGNARPAGGAPDAGAFEYGASTEPPPPPADTTAPETSISSSPSSSTTETAASFAFSATESGSTFECRLDGGSWTACTSPKGYADLAVGAHDFAVRATDAAGNVDATPATRNWTIVTPPDTTAPNTSISSSPSSSTIETGASFVFSATESGSTFECRLDGGSWTACVSPAAYAELAVGAHSFAVRATDAAGNTDATPATRNWTVVTPPDTTAPETSISSSPSSSTIETGASFAFSATESGSTFECRLDGGSWTACVSPKGYADLAVGAHDFAVRATDAAGNVDATPATFTWTITAPVVDPPVVDPPVVDPPVVDPPVVDPPVVDPPVLDPVIPDPVVIVPPVIEPLPPIVLPDPPAVTLPNAKPKPRIVKATLGDDTLCRKGSAKCPAKTTLTVSATGAEKLTVTVKKRATSSRAAARASKLSRTSSIVARASGKSTTTVSAKDREPGIYTVTIVAQNGDARSSSCVLVLTVR